MTTDTFIDVTDFQFRALRRVRLFSKCAVKSSSQCVPSSLITTSPHFGITVVGSSEGALISFRTADVHCLEAKDSNRDIEVNNLCLKKNVLPGNENDELIALGCSCNGRVLSALVNTSNGPFVYLMDICALSPDYSSKAGVVQSIRVSSRNEACGIALEWNPQLEGVFAVIANDGTLSTYLFDIQNAARVSIVGTTTLSVAANCLSWSPKGKQLVIGDNDGKILQYKPEMALVRTVAAPVDIPSMQGEAVRSVGLCWLATTDFMVAYSSQNGDKVDIASLTVKKDTPPKWTHFDDVTYNGSRSSFAQRIIFVPLHSWHILLCASSKSTEVALLGKVENTWKCWQLDDTSRIETPLSRKGEETFPVGLCIDTSSQVNVTLNDDGTMERPPCPTVMVFSTDGVLHSFSAISFKPEHKNINSAPARLPETVFGGVVPERAFPELESIENPPSVVAPQDMSTVSNSAAILTSANVVQQQQQQQQQQQATPTPVSILPQTTSTPLAQQPAQQMQSFLQKPSPQSISTPPSTQQMQSFFQKPSPQSISTPPLTQQNISSMFSKGPSLPTAQSLSSVSSPSVPKPASAPSTTAQIVPPSFALSQKNAIATSSNSLADIKPKIDEDLPKIRSELRTKLHRFDEAIYSLRERNDWLRDLCDSLCRNRISEFSGVTSEEGLIDDVQELRVCVDGLIEQLEFDIKETMVLVKEQQHQLKSTTAEPRHCNAEKLLDFDRSYRQNKLERSLQKICSKVQMVNDQLDRMSTSSIRASAHNRGGAPVLSAEDEQCVVKTARNVCKAVISRKRVVAELQRKLNDLLARSRMATKIKETNDSSVNASTNHGVSEGNDSSVLNYLSQSKIVVADDDSYRQINGKELCSHEKKLLRLRAFAMRNVSAVPRKVNAITQEPWHPPVNQTSTSILSRIEAKLNQVSVSPTRNATKIMLDVGTQSPSFTKYADEVKAHEAQQRPVFSVPVAQKSLPQQSQQATQPVYTSTTSSLFNKLADNGANRAQSAFAASSLASSIPLPAKTMPSSSTFTVLPTTAVEAKPKSILPTPPDSSASFKFASSSQPANESQIPASSQSANRTSTQNVNASQVEEKKTMFGVQSGAQQKQEGEVGTANVNAPRTSNLFASIVSSSTSSTQQQQSTQKTSSSENALNKPLAGASSMTDGAQNVPASTALSTTSGVAVPIASSDTTKQQTASSSQDAKSVAGSTSKPATPSALTSTQPQAPTTMTATATTPQTSQTVSTTSPSASTSPSIQNTQTTTSIQQPITSTSPSTSTSSASVPAKPADTAVSFTFKLPTATTTSVQDASADQKSFTKSAQESTVQQNNMDEGMMDDEGAAATSAVSTNLFSSALSLGIGGATSTSTPQTAKSIFGGGMKLGGGITQPASSSLFGSAVSSAPASSVFGGGVNATTTSNVSGSAFQMGTANAPRTSSLFGSIMSSSTSSTQQQQQSTPSFSFSAALANPQQSTGSVFGAKPVVTGATSTFGGAPTFGSKPTFGARSPLASAFSQASGVQATQPTVPSSGGIFSAFAHSGVSSGFGALAAASQQQGQKSSLFGGSGFGSLVQQQQQQQKPSVFGGSTFGAQANTQSSAFSTWRSG